MKCNYFLLLLISPIGIIAQKAQTAIQLGPMDNPSLLTSLICVSTKSGQPVFEHFLTENEIYNGSAFSVPRNPDSIYHLTILNEYQVDTINEGLPFMRGMTYHTIDTAIQLLFFRHVQPDTFFYGRTVLMNVLDCPAIKDVRFYSSKRKQSLWKYNDKKSSLWIAANYEPGEDVFIVIQSFQDKALRYIHWYGTEVPYVQSKPASLADAVNLFWNRLPIDPESVSLRLPMKVGVGGKIQIRNYQLGTRITAFDYQMEHIDTNSIQYYLPPVYRNSPVQVDLWTSESMNFKKSLEYHYVHEFPNKIPSYRTEDFYPSNFTRDSNTTSINLAEGPELFQITLIRSHFQSFDVPGHRFNQLTYSRWRVRGKNTGQMEFTLPNISTGAGDKFLSYTPDNRKWWVNEVVGIKFLESFSGADWKNFLPDYNLMYIHLPENK